MAIIQHTNHLTLNVSIGSVVWSHTQSEEGINSAEYKNLKAPSVNFFYGLVIKKTSLFFSKCCTCGPELK